MEESDDRPLKLCTPASVDGGRAEALPDDGFADVSGNEEGNT